MLQILEFDANSSGHICYHINVLLIYLYATGQWYNIALQLFSNLCHLIYVENVDHVSIIN